MKSNFWWLAIPIGVFVVGMTVAYKAWDGMYAQPLSEFTFGLMWVAIAVVIMLYQGPTSAVPLSNQMPIRPFAIVPIIIAIPRFISGLSHFYEINFVWQSLAEFALPGVGLLIFCAIFIIQYQRLPDRTPMPRSQFVMLSSMGLMGISMILYGAMLVLVPGSNCLIPLFLAPSMVLLAIGYWLMWKEKARRSNNL